MISLWHDVHSSQPGSNKSIGSNRRKVLLSGQACNMYIMTTMINLVVLGCPWVWSAKWVPFRTFKGAHTQQNNTVWPLSGVVAAVPTAQQRLNAHKETATKARATCCCVQLVFYFQYIPIVEKIMHNFSRLWFYGTLHLYPRWRPSSTSRCCCWYCQ